MFLEQKGPFEPCAVYQTLVSYWGKFPLALLFHCHFSHSVSGWIMALHVPENIALIIHLFSNQKHVQVDSKILPALKISITCYKMVILIT